MFEYTAFASIASYSASISFESFLVTTFTYTNNGCAH